METLIGIQHWLYRSIGEGLSSVAGGVKVVASLLPRQVQAEVSGPTHEDRVTALAERLARLDHERAEQSRSRE